MARIITLDDDTAREIPLNSPRVSEAVKLVVLPVVEGLDVGIGSKLKAPGPERTLRLKPIAVARPILAVGNLEVQPVPIR